MNAALRSIALASLPLLCAVACNGIYGIDPPNIVSPDAGASDASALDATDTGSDGPVSACGDTQVDAHNCGRCGHDCLGADCAGGLCKPVLLTQGQNRPYAIQVQGSSVYWANLGTDGVRDGTIVTCATSGCGLQGPTLLVQSIAYPSDIAVNATDVFFLEAPCAQTTDASLYRCKSTGCGGGALVRMAQGLQCSEAMTLDDANVYWSNNDPSNTNPGPSTVMSCPLASCGTGPTTLGTIGVFADRVAVSSGFVFWTDANQPVGALYGCPLTGCTGTPPTIASAQSFPTGLTAFGGSLYWTNNRAGAIMTCKIASGRCASTPAVATSGQAQPNRIVADASGVYWVDLGDGAIRMLPYSGGSAVTITTGQAPHALALDATSVYFTNRDQGTVMKVAK